MQRRSQRLLCSVPQAVSCASVQISVQTYLSVYHLSCLSVYRGRLWSVVSECLPATDGLQLASLLKTTPKKKKASKKKKKKKEKKKKLGQHVWDPGPVGDPPQCSICDGAHHHPDPTLHAGQNGSNYQSKSVE